MSQSQGTKVVLSVSDLTLLQKGVKSGALSLDTPGDVCRKKYRKIAAQSESENLASANHSGKRHASRGKMHHCPSSHRMSEWRRSWTNLSTLAEQQLAPSSSRRGHKSE